MRSNPIFAALLLLLVACVAPTSAAGRLVNLQLKKESKKGITYPYQPTPSKPHGETLPFGTGSILTFKSIGIGSYCSVTGCSPEDWDCEGILTCDPKTSGSLDDGLMLSGSDFMSREVHSGDDIMLKSSQTNKYCSPSDKGIVSCAERHYDDEALFVIKKADLPKSLSNDRESSLQGLGYPGGRGGGGGDEVKTVIRFRPADSPHSWCHPFLVGKGKKTVYEIKCGGHFDEGMDLFEVVDVGGGGGSWAPPTEDAADQ